MIPLSEPLFQGNEWKYLQDCLDSGWISAAGPLTAKLEQAFSQHFQAPDAVAVSSGTAALHLALKAAEVQAGDLVLVSDYSFIASANAIRYCGADPVFMETDPETWQANAEAVAEWLTQHCEKRKEACFHVESGKRIQALVLVHAYGQLADAFRFKEISQAWGIRMIEDAAGAIGSLLQGKSAGTIAEFGCISLNGNKLITAGGGGIVFCQNAEAGTYIRHLSRQAKEEGLEYQHDELGYNYRLPDLMAAIALAQFEVLNDYIARKQSIYQQYQQALPKCNWQKLIPNSEPNHWMIAFRAIHKDALLKHLMQQGIQARAGWYPLHLQKPYQHCLFAGNPQHTIDIYNQVICLPYSVGLKESEIETVGKIVHDFLNR